MTLLSPTGMLALLSTFLIGCASVSAATFTWQEEVLLQDGGIIVVERSVERGGRHEIGQDPPIKAQRLTFRLRGTSELVVWNDAYSEAIGRASFLPMQLELQGSTAYLVAHPMGSLSYKNWGQPNPPYVVFKYEEKQWRRIALDALPSQFSIPNLLFSSPDDEAKKQRGRMVSADTIRKLYAGYPQPEYRTIVRTPVERWNARPIYSGPRAPHPIGPPAPQN